MVLLESLAISYIGSEILTDSTRTIYQKITNIISFTTPDVEHIYNELDIKSSVKLIGQTIKDFEEKYIKNIKEYNLEKSIVMAFNEIHLVIEEIEKTMLEIDNQVNEHNEKWVSSWRTPNYLNNIKKIKILNTHLKTRFNSFCEIVKMFKFT